MNITFEHYQDFIETLAQDISDIDRQITALEQGMGNDPDPAVYYECQQLWDCGEYLERLHKYFYNEENQIEYDSLDALKEYVQELDTYDEELYALTMQYLPNELEDLVGCTEEEWNLHEEHRYEVHKELVVWSAFADFCEFGTI